MGARAVPAAIAAAAVAVAALVLAAALAAGLGPAPARAAGERVVAGLSQNRIAITANFDGSEIMIFGAVRREAPPPEGGPLQVIVTVTGPSEPVIVRRKARVFGVWANTEAVEVDAAPSFYAVATSAPLAEILAEVEDLRHRISIVRMIRSVGAPMEIADSQRFSEALVRIREAAGLTRDRRVIDVYETTIDVSKVGLERWIYTLAHERPLVYGLLSLFIAIAAGWGASAIFSRIRA